MLSAAGALVLVGVPRCPPFKGEMQSAVLRSLRAQTPALRTQVWANASRAGRMSHSVRSMSAGVSSSMAEKQPVTVVIENATKVDASTLDNNMTPRQIVSYLNKHIVGQKDAKRAIAIAMRNRWRRMKLLPPMKDEVMPKNILMIGPTGVGKTEVARRLAKLAGAPFIKVEATKYTEVGFHGKDVDTIIKDLVEVAILLQRNKLKQQMKAEIATAVENRILDIMVGEAAQPFTRESMRNNFREGLLDDMSIDIDLPANNGSRMPDMKGGFQVGEIILKMGEGIMGPKTQSKKMKISACRPILEDLEAERLINADTIERDAVKNTEENGIVFIDEIDKIVDVHNYGADASAEGVQRDLLPLIEGSTISTKYGNVKTDHILFVCSGAFHNCKPSDLLAELQGRLPIRVEMKALTEEDFYLILTVPESNLVKQQVALLATEGMKVSFEESAIREIAKVTAEINSSVENIGARRLHTVLERIMDEVSFTADEYASKEFAVTAAYVRERISPMLIKNDLSKYIL